ncbi:MAG TPA: DUF192 domain-containing protein [Candidatus Cybelea sp.]
MYNLAFLLAAALPAVVVHAPHADLTLEVARTQAQREYGLMNRTRLAPNTGMIFVFGGDAPVAFWMKDTLVPLDMLFIAADGTVRRVFADVAVVPRSLPDANIPRESDVAKYVIELPAGEAAQDGIAAGVHLDLRSVPPAT